VSREPSGSLFLCLPPVFPLGNLAVLPRAGVSHRELITKLGEESIDEHAS
jgi:hypothetical protein